MKRLLYITMLLGVILMSAVSSLKWRQISDVVTTLTEINYLHGITGKPLTRSSADSIYNQIANNINPHDSVWYKDETYHKDTIDSKLSKKANLYQPALVNPTVTTQASGDNSTKAASTAFVANSYINPVGYMMKLMGLPVISVPSASYALLSNLETMVDGNAIICIYEVKEDTTITGFRVAIGTQGVYTADNYNGIKIYSVSGTVGTEIGATVDDGNLWKASSNTIITKNLPTPITLTAGKYMIASVWNASATTTAPKIYHFGAANYFAGMAPNNMKLVESRLSQATLPSSIDFNNAGSATSVPIRGIWIY